MQLPGQRIRDQEAGSKDRRSIDGDGMDTGAADMLCWAMLHELHEQDCGAALCIGIRVLGGRIGSNSLEALRWGSSELKVGARC